MSDDLSELLRMSVEALEDGGVTDEHRYDAAAHLLFGALQRVGEAADVLRPVSVMPIETAQRIRAAALVLTDARKACQDRGRYPPRRDNDQD